MVAVMEYSEGKWIMQGLVPSDKNHKNRLKSCDEMIDYIDKVGFLPLFSWEAKGFSVEEMTDAFDWFCDNPKTDPWLWRKEAARSKKVAYGKFFNKRAGFVSLEWFRHLVNFRRDGYDFDSLVDEGLAQRRQQLIMKVFEENQHMYSCEVKKLAGFSKGGEKNFNGIVTDLQMKTYLLLTDFKQKVSKKGNPYGMEIAIYSTPESVWGYDAVTEGYAFEPEESREKILTHIKGILPNADDRIIEKMFL